MPPRSTYVFGPFLLDPSEHQLWKDGRRVHLTPKVFELLQLLVVEHNGRLVEKEELLKSLWPDSFVDDGGLARCVSVLRKALGDGSGGARYIETVPKRGYRFVAEITQTSTTSTAAEVAAVRPAPARWPRARTRLVVAAGLVAASIVTVPAYLGLRSVPLPIPPAPERTEATNEPRTASPSLPPKPTVQPVAKPSVPAEAVHRQFTFTGRESLPAISPDGRYVAYITVESPERRVLVQDLEGGAPLTVFAAPEAGDLRWSPDGLELVVWSRGTRANGLYVLSRSGAPPVYLAPEGSAAAWSPDGATLAYARPLTKQIVFQTRRPVPSRSFTMSGITRWVWDLDWSAKGLVVVTNDLDGRYTIWTVQPDGSGEKRLLEEQAEITAARWAPNGAAVYYVRRVGQMTSVHKLDLTTSEVRSTAVVTGLETDGAISFSGDGRRLVYARAPLSSNLAVVERSATESGAAASVRWLTQGTALVERPQVSPDGKLVLFNSGPEGLTNLYTVPLAGGIPAQLTFLKAFNVGGVWSPDGQRVAFASTFGGRRRVLQVGVNGGVPQALSSGELSDSFALSWSPGPEVLYQQAGNRNFYAIDPSTRAERLLLRNPSVGWVFSPVYSPDAKRIALSWNRPDARGLWLVDPTGGSEAPFWKTSILMPLGWAPDGQSVYVFDGKRAAYRGVGVYLGETLERPSILKVALDGTMEPVLTLPFDEVGGIAMTPDARRFICAVYSTRSDIWIVDNFDQTRGQAR